MPWIIRYAAALHNIGLRQAAHHAWHRARRRARRYGRYERAKGDLCWVGRAATPFLEHSGGARLGEGRFTAVGFSRHVGMPPDWDCEGPLLWRYNLHSFAYLHALPREVQVRLVHDWIQRYGPSARRPGWMPNPISLRLRHWVQGLFAAEWLTSRHAELFASIEAQARCLADTLELDLRGNHLLENALTLKAIAACFTGSPVERWGRIADDLLRRELPEQFLVDGGHFERSPMYHGLVTVGLLDLLNVLPSADRFRAVLVERLPAILRFAAALRHPDGEIALFNDAATDIAPPPQAVLDYADRLGVDVPSADRGAFRDSGYYVWQRDGDAIIVDAGPVGPDYLPGHGHGDMFSYELSLDGRRVVVDGGTSTYEAGPERDWVRSTRAHNTVEVAQTDQCEFFAAFRVGRRARPHDVTGEVTEHGLQVSGWHDGYYRLPGHPIHHRELGFVFPGVLLVWDTVESGVAHPAVSRIRLAPGARVRAQGPHDVEIEIESRVLNVRAFGGELILEQDHYAPRFGERLPCPVLALHKGPGPEFGYALARRDIPTAIDAGSAEVAGRRVTRRSRPLAPPRGQTA